MSIILHNNWLTTWQ